MALSGGRAIQGLVDDDAIFQVSFGLLKDPDPRNLAGYAVIDHNIGWGFLKLVNQLLDSHMFSYVQPGMMEPRRRERNSQSGMFRQNFVYSRYLDF